MTLSFSSYAAPGSITGAGVGNGGNLPPNVFMSTKVGGSVRKSKRSVKGGQCPCMKSGTVFGGKSKKGSKSKKRHTRARK
jgi:hypothetical protein